MLSLSPGDVFIVYSMEKYRPAVYLHTADRKHFFVPLSKDGDSRLYDKDINVKIKKKHNNFLEETSIATVSMIQGISESQELGKYIGSIRSKDLLKIRLSLKYNFVGLISLSDLM
ncbi:type II toxin-antitoxin system PemK/MazF family toxin [Paenibacillus sp. NEAU-GSW1]|uniref:type II toxin-antitoxin system PemK/MazF family toxin n=1 Tax=Paenibacillus sp. NEAU-GSW1 TaxID=2682486 RepID=UPI0012E23946|nr:type II toxin-antitoxin system PemK/MazF family toxin [Paenibacillus sp. NEAU-GSW1]MUT68505.1 hypothetical protein [Paenibacillus sp. NEAU-GSW1]